MIQYGPSPTRSLPGEASQELKLTEIDADSSDTKRLSYLQVRHYRTLTEKNYNTYLYGPKEKIPLTPLLSAELIHQILFF